MSSPDLDPQAVLAAVYKAGSVDKAWPRFQEQIALKKFHRYCQSNGINWAKAKEAFGNTDNVTIEAPQTVQVVLKPNYRISQKGGASDKLERVLGIGDPHDSPFIREKDRFFWMGRYCAEHRIPRVRCAGDLATMDSLCRYERNETLRGKRKPSFKDDMASLREALTAFNEGLGEWAPDKHVTLGNHEDRVFSFTNNHPEVAGMMEENIHTILADFGWNYSPFGAISYLGGVGFTHVPLNRMGKPYGGKHAENQIGNDSTTDIVYGHSHGFFSKPFWKLGGEKIRVVNLGTALPHGHTEDYAKHSLGDGNWDWGVADMTIQHGHVQRADWVSMLALEAAYG